MKRMKFQKPWLDQALEGLEMSDICRFFWNRSIKTNVSSLPLDFLKNEEVFQNMLRFYAKRHIAVIDQENTPHYWQPYPDNLDEILHNLYSTSVWSLSGDSLLKKASAYFDASDPTYPLARFSFISDALFPLSTVDHSVLEINARLAIIGSILQDSKFNDMKKRDFRKPQIFPHQIMQRMIAESTEADTMKIFAARPALLKKMVQKGNKDTAEYARINWNVIGPMNTSTVTDKRWHQSFFRQFTGIAAPPQCLAPYDWVNVLLYSLFGNPDLVLELQPILHASEPMTLWMEPL